MTVKFPNEKHVLNLGRRRVGLGQTSHQASASNPGKLPCADQTPVACRRKAYVTDPPLLSGLNISSAKRLSFSKQCVIGALLTCLHSWESHSAYLPAGSPSKLLSEPVRLLYLEPYGETSYPPGASWETSQHIIKGLARGSVG